METSKIVFKYSRYLSNVNQGHIVMIRRVQRVVRAKQEEYQEKYRNLCNFGIRFQM